MAHTHLTYQERFYIEQRLAEGLMLIGKRSAKLSITHNFLI